MGELSWEAVWQLFLAPASYEEKDRFREGLLDVACLGLRWGGIVGVGGVLAYGVVNLFVLRYTVSWSYGALGVSGSDMFIPTLLLVAAAYGGLIVLAIRRCTLPTARLAMGSVVLLSVGLVAYDGARTGGRITDYVGLIYLIGVAAVPYRPWQVLGLGLGLSVVIGGIGIPNPVVGTIGNGLSAIYSQLTFVGITAVLLTGISAVLYLRHWERIRSQEALAESRQRFRGVFEEAGLGIALTTETGTVIEANPALESMFGVEDGGLDGCHYAELSHPDDLEQERALYKALRRGETDQYQLEKRYIRDDDSVFWAHLTVSLRRGPNGPQIIGLIKDIDAEKKRKERLRLFRKALEQAHEAVVISEHEATAGVGAPILYANPAFTDMTGYEPEEVIGESPHLLRGPDTEPWVLQQLRRRIRQGRNFEGEAINYRKDGTPFVNRWSSAPVRDENGDITHWVSVQRDVTSKRRMDHRLLEVQDEERRRIDEEIHSEMGGLLATLQFAVSRARMATSGSPAEPLDRIVELVDDLSNITRSISRRLYPGELDDHGLMGALSSLVRLLDEQYGLTVEMESALDADERFPSLVEVTAYRVVHEALINVVQHAQTDTAYVHLCAHAQELHLRIIDNGQGFNPGRQREATYGLAGMRERVGRLNGELEIDAEPGEGTQIAVTLPLTVLPDT
ncbi:hypothetical protein BSZ35_11490 [Salinibacter sp. 10B]|nr:hypothetical protein BSZ35_11490 [Salinibacter sp. 10B]